ncbi:MAG: hypothetical protein ABEI97_03665 [Candidatus Nanohaloarchaea archaeon]
MAPPVETVSAGATDHDPVGQGDPTTYYEDLVRVPGFDTAPERCRDYTPVGFCDHGHTILGRSSCGTRRCPDHWRDWCEDAVIEIVARLAAYRHAVDGAEKPASHVMASPPQDRRYSAQEMWDTRSEAYDALRAAGVNGGPVVTHPYRTNERGNALYSTAQESGQVEEDTGRWAFLRDVAEQLFGGLVLPAEQAAHPELGEDGDVEVTVLRHGPPSGVRGTTFKLFV